ncbi:unnamed protein product [Aureobasidium uvarum]|uniref:Uncharacterized protein n=1 Tax=Aureobasidium uvarum TaxID=2773716 RepID=A0A9N8KDH3_9PEZI|nr:unnamed protein product [Aureobasidium uvarum]
MFLSSPRKKSLATYSKQTPRTNHCSTLASPTSDDRQHRKGRVTLTSPVRAETPLTSPSSISLSPSFLSDHKDDQAQQVELPTEPPSAHELALVTPSDQIARPVSSSEHDSISDHELTPMERGRKKRTRRDAKPQPLSKLRKSLNVRPKKLRFTAKQPTSVPSAETIREIERGADGFDEMHLVLLAVSRPKKRKLKAHSTTVALETLIGPHPHVNFDDPDWLAVPYQDHLKLEQKATYHTTEATRDESKFEGVVIENAHLQVEEFRSARKPPTRPSAKEVLLYAQLSSVSAPIMRHPSYDEESEEHYANNFMDNEEGEGEGFEHSIGDGELGEQRASTVR